MFSTKCHILMLVSIAAMLLLTELVPVITAARLPSSCFLVKKGDPLNPTIQDETSGQCMVWNAPINGCAYQGWWLRGAGDTFSITNMGTGRVLDSNHKGDVYTSGPNSGLFQKRRWNGDCLQNVATRLYLTIEWQVCAKPYTGAANQQWERYREILF